MKLALLCRNAKLYSHKRLVEAAQQRGHTIDIIDHLQCLIDVCPCPLKLDHLLLSNFDRKRDGYGEETVFG